MTPHRKGNQRVCNLGVRCRNASCGCTMHFIVFSGFVVYLMAVRVAGKAKDQDHTSHTICTPFSGFSGACVAVRSRGALHRTPGEAWVELSTIMVTSFRKVRGLLCVEVGAMDRLGVCLASKHAFSFFVWLFTRNIHTSYSYMLYTSRGPSTMYRPNPGALVMRAITDGAPTVDFCCVLPMSM